MSQAHESEGQEGVFDRRMVFCESLLSRLTTDKLYKLCDDCDQYLCICCPDDGLDYACHHYPVVFVDGACSNNGRYGAKSGIGGIFGEKSGFQWSIPVDERIDSSSVRTNQRAELLAAITGVKRLSAFLLHNKPDLARRTNRRDRVDMVVATDSEYVCQGVAELLPKWKRNGWKNSAGRPVANKDLFCELDDAITALERGNINVGFWWIDRRYNTTADALAKEACAAAFPPISVEYTGLAFEMD